MRTVSAVYFRKGLLSKLALLVKSSQIIWNCDTVGKNCDIFWNQACIVQSIFRYRKTAESWQRSSGTTASSFLRQILRQIGPALVHRSWGGQPWHSLCAVLGVWGLLPCWGRALAVPVGQSWPWHCCVVSLQSRWRSGAGPLAWAQTTRTSRPRRRCGEHSPSDPKLSLSEGLLALQQFSCAASLQRGDDKRAEPDNQADCGGIVGFLSPLIFLVCLPGSLKSWEQQEHSKWLFS